jgi:hypothetical protein
LLKSDASFEHIAGNIVQKNIEYGLPLSVHLAAMNLPTQFFAYVAELYEQVENCVRYFHSLGVFNAMKLQKISEKRIKLARFPLFY